MYKLKAGEMVRRGKLYGWTGKKCPPCGGYGEDEEARACGACSGTGDEYGLMPIQPKDLPPEED